MDPLSVLATWLIKQLGKEAAARAKVGLKAFILGPTVERALVQPTSHALAVAIRGQLGDKATPEREQRAINVMSMIWINDLVVVGNSDTLLGQVRAVVARAIEVANAPVFGLPEEFLPTSSLTALSDELGVVFDGDAIAGSFIEAWVRAVRDRALTDSVLAPLADHLAHEQTQELIHQLPSEERIGQILKRAIQSSVDGGAKDAAWIGRERWFQVHVAPVDEAMHDIYDDYSRGFAEAANALRSSRDLDRAISMLSDFRRRKVASRISVQAMARVLTEERANSPFDAEVQVNFKDLLNAVHGFIFGADKKLEESWYSYYIDQFEKLRSRGQDPLVRSNYDIAGDHDLRGPLAVVLESVADDELPTKWREYVESFTRLKLSCLSP